MNGLRYLEHALDLIENYQGNDRDIFNAHGLLKTAILEINAGWKTIESAPKDRLVLLTCVGWEPSKRSGEHWPVKIGGWWDEKWNIFGASWNPTHWMECPDSPENNTIKAVKDE